MRRKVPLIPDIGKRAIAGHGAPMQRLARLLAAAATLALVAPNWGAMLDALVYRSVVAQARGMLPDGWQTLVSGTPTAQSAALQAAQSPAQRAAILALPRGFETELLDLRDGCFRQARRDA